ncbi:MAG TPA: hypothetical protein VF747_00790 [Blastocatellia bacterium]|jgi:hypothetical protein
MLHKITRRLALPVTMIIASLLLLMPGLHAASARAKSGPLARALRSERNGWIYIHLEGAPEEIGYQHGFLLAREIDEALRVFKKYLKHVTARDWQFYWWAAHEMFWNKIGDEYQKEIAGIARGAYSRGVKIDADDVLAMNGWMELAWY